MVQRYRFFFYLSLQFSWRLYYRKCYCLYFYSKLTFVPDVIMELRNRALNSNIGLLLQLAPPNSCLDSNLRQLLASPSTAVRGSTGLEGLYLSRAFSSGGLWLDVREGEMRLWWYRGNALWPFELWDRIF